MVVCQGLPSKLIGFVSRAEVSFRNLKYKDGIEPINN
jgi:hypothetical protein